jgi:hypothetical protein
MDIEALSHVFIKKKKQKGTERKKKKTTITFEKNPIRLRIAQAR